MPAKKPSDKSLPAVQVTSVLTPERGQLGANFLRLADDITDGDIKNVVIGLRHIYRSHLWWIGDIISEVARLRPQTDAHGKAISDAHPLKNERVCMIADSFGIGTEERIRQIWRVCFHIPPDKRIQGASFTHHETALREASGDIKLAIKWVRLAADEGLSVSKMRAELRQDMAKPIERCEPETDPDREVSIRFSEFYRIKRIVSQIDIKDMTKDDRQTLKSDMKEVVDFLNRL